MMKIIIRQKSKLAFQNKTFKINASRTLALGIAASNINIPGFALTVELSLFRWLE